MAEINPVTLTLNSAGRITNVDFAQWIMSEINGKVYTRKDVAHTYAILIDKGHKEWRDINKAIIKRWSASGLQWIKTQAWKQLNA